MQLTPATPATTKGLSLGLSLGGRACKWGTSLAQASVCVCRCAGGGYTHNVVGSSLLLQLTSMTTTYNVS